MNLSDAGDGAADDASGVRNGASYWAAAGFAALVALAAAIPSLRTLVLAVVTFPLRVAGWILPGGDVYADAVSAAAILGWLGWCLLAFLWAPLLVVAVSGALKLAPALEAPGKVWADAIRGERGLAFRVVAWAAALAPAVVAIALTALGYLLPWALGPAVLASAALASPALARGDELPVLALARLVAARVGAAIGVVGAGARWMTLALVIVVTIAVTQRYVFGITFTKLDELVVYLHAATFMLVAAATLRVDGHVRVDVVYGARSPRGRALINFIGVYALLTPLCLVILATSPRYVDLAWRVSEGSTETDGLPLVYLLKTVIPVFGVLMLAQGAALAARDALVLAGADSGEDDAPPEHHEVI